MQVKLTESNVKRIIELLKRTETVYDRLLAEHLEKLLQVENSYKNIQAIFSLNLYE